MKAKNRIGMYSSITSLLSVSVYAISLLLSVIFTDGNSSVVGSIGTAGSIGIIGIYVSGIVISVSFILVVFSHLTQSFTGIKYYMVFSLIISIVYGIENIVSSSIQFFNIFFPGNSVPEYLLLYENHLEIFIVNNMFGYALISIALIFAGISLEVYNRKGRLLQKLMYLHIFFVFLYMLYLILLLFNRVILQFTALGLLIMLLWSFYFSLLSFLSYNYFKQKNDGKIR